MENRDFTRLLELDLKNAGFEEVIQALNACGEIPIFSVYVGAGMSIYRARPHSSDQKLHFPQELSYRTDVENIVSFGRANVPGSSMFYGTINTDEIKDGVTQTAIETSNFLRKNVNGVQTLTVGKWVLKHGIHIGVILNSNKYDGKNNYINKLRLAFDEFLKTTDDFDFNKRLSVFIADQFSKPVSEPENKEYMISAAFAAMALDGRVPLCGLAYPSVQSDYGGVNLVMNPNLVEKLLEFDQAVLVQLHKNNDVVKVAQFQHTESSYLFKSIPFNWKTLGQEYNLGLEWIDTV